ncbi:MAG: insulinase family protein, partial [Nanoarchaeota archaeon]|nr:insulinase family protein [Nanoarchaeota archaeon]
MNDNNRLFRKLRERKGLCYSVTASISNTCDLVPGIFDISVTSSPDNHDEVIREIFIELNEIMENGISNDELDFPGDGTHGSRARDLMVYLRATAVEKIKELSVDKVLNSEVVCIRKKCWFRS